MQNFNPLAYLEVLLLLRVYIVSCKETKRTFLTPDGGHTSGTSLCGPSGVIMPNFKSLASQEVLLLLHVSIMSSKEAKRMFLTPEGGIPSGSGLDKPLWTFLSCHVKFKFSS
jgi:hypothetical protein